VVARRNPYYWKVDPSGRQLPYIDDVTTQLVADNEVAKLKTLSGDVDLVYSTITMDIRDKPVIALPASNYGVVSNRLHNVQNPMIDDWPWQTPGPTNMPQYFIGEKTS
jgi:ABC-type transport system substrate-binding protein